MSTAQQQAPSSPSKRRVLGDLDVNVSSPKRKNMLKTAAPGAKPESSLLSEETRKRRFAAMAGNATTENEQLKRTCLDSTTADEENFPAAAQQLQQQQQVPDESDSQQAAASPAASSVFDTSAHDTTLATTVTEPDTDGPNILRSVAAAASSRIPSRAELTRQTAETLRLRLRLAAYKLKTGQADVPLEQLQMRPVSQSERPMTSASNTDAEPRFLASSLPPSSINTTTAGRRIYEPLHHAPRRPPTADCSDDSEDEYGGAAALASSWRASARPLAVAGGLRLSPPSRSILPAAARMRPDDEDNLTGGAASGLLELRNSSQ
ncbi:hypothetical protein PpBr36_00430 [Pyricularia pennisetigena]|uniref:hypothetical protein n=1 Tax=Pyricularia pennisetigena TaxID=1578925 RepID=UPI00114E5C72|nr:hypothetical protein PpBr36_00430 [Pyricularia pennisetigena]TLS29549.1 hypothetical protein PpBr36_00430 [Pyricularia pennisetigena]